MLPAERTKAVRSMDESRARALLRAERAEVATLLRETEEAVKVDQEAPDSATDYADEALPLTEEATARGRHLRALGAQRQAHPRPAA
jgi:hypothetical protein